MPTLKLSWSSTLTYQVLATTSSEATSTRPKSLTPMIAGSVCGGAMGIAWIIGFTIYFTKRYKRKKLNRQVAAGIALPKMKQTKVSDDKVIVPPDPAILLGHRLPGEGAFKGDGNTGSEYRQKIQSQERGVSVSNLRNPPPVDKLPPLH